MGRNLNVGNKKSMSPMKIIILLIFYLFMQLQFDFSFENTILYKNYFLFGLFPLFYLLYYIILFFNLFSDRLCLHNILQNSRFLNS